MRRLVSALAAIAVLAFGLHACGRRERDIAPPDLATAPADSAPGVPQTGTTALPGPDPEAAAGAQARRDAADIVQRYLQALAAGDAAAADALWQARRAPSAQDEDGLRALLPALNLQIRNDAPEPVDTDSPPSRLRVPVRLRLADRANGLHRFAGHYIVRRDPVTRTWSITSASVRAELGGR